MKGGLIPISNSTEDDEKVISRGTSKITVIATLNMVHFSHPFLGGREIFIKDASMLSEFKFAFLWTDILFYILLITTIFFILWARHYEHLRAPWRNVFNSKLAMVAFVILLAYIVIGLLDSIHIRKALPREENQQIFYSGKVESVLDILVSPLGQEDEMTYSAPFSLHLYNEQTEKLSNGMHVQIHPRLIYGGLNIVNAHQRLINILKEITIGSLKAIAVWLLLASAIVFMIAKQKQYSFWKKLKIIFQGQANIAWGSSLIVMLLLFIFIFCSLELAKTYHVFGTDKVGKDIFYEAIKSIRTGLLIGTLTTLFMLPFAILFGTMAGYFRGWIDDVIQYVYTTLSSIPGVLLISAAILSLQIHMSNHPELFPTLAARADIRLLALCIILGITSWTSLCRLLRAETLKIREQDFIQAAVTLGVSHSRIITRHILPNVMHIILITVVLDFSGLVLAEAVLSYVGVGVDPTTFSWGNMINSARLELARDPVVWWPLCAAFIFMFGLVLSANFFADAVRDAFDPRLRNLS